MSEIFNRYSRGRPWSEQGCLERLITIFLVLVVAAICLGGVVFVVMVLTAGA